MLSIRWHIRGKVTYKEGDWVLSTSEKPRLKKMKGKYKDGKPTGHQKFSPTPCALFLDVNWHTGYCKYRFSMLHIYIFTISESLSDC